MVRYVLLRPLRPELDVIQNNCRIRFVGILRYVHFSSAMNQEQKVKEGKNVQKNVQKASKNVQEIQRPSKKSKTDLIFFILFLKKLTLVPQNAYLGSQKQ
jgi:hypothetical protein